METPDFKQICDDAVRPLFDDTVLKSIVLKSILANKVDDSIGETIDADEIEVKRGIYPTLKC